MSWEGSYSVWCMIESSQAPRRRQRADWEGSGRGCGGCGGCGGAEGVVMYEAVQFGTGGSRMGFLRLIWDFQAGCSDFGAALAQMSRCWVQSGARPRVRAGGRSSWN
jgi:hypothetical protein